MTSLRRLGEVTLSDERPDRTADEQAATERALTLLREEVARMTALRAELATEVGRGAPAEPTRRLDAMAARLEGASRFALRMGLVTPAEVREVWAEAARSGVHDRPSPGAKDDVADDVRGGDE